MEKEKWKKIVAIALIAVIVLTLLLIFTRCQGCGGNTAADLTDETVRLDGKPTEETTKSTTEPAESPEPTESVEQMGTESAAPKDTEPAPTEPVPTTKPTEPAPTEPKTTEPVHTHSYEVSKTVAATGHSWVHYHTDAVGHEECYFVCHCGGWSFKVTSLADDLGPSFQEHKKQVLAETGTTAGHSYYDSYVWVIDTPAVDYDECSVCGARK